MSGCGACGGGQIMDAGCGGGGCCDKCKGCRPGPYPPPGRNYHCGMPAPEYPVPFYTPHPTAHTYLTYPPVHPHNSLPQYRGTYSFRHGCGLSRTNVHWRPTRVCNAIDYAHHLIEPAR